MQLSKAGTNLSSLFTASTTLRLLFNPLLPLLSLALSLSTDLAFLQQVPFIPSSTLHNTLHYTQPVSLAKLRATRARFEWKASREELGERR